MHIWDSLQWPWLWRNESAVFTDLLFTRQCRKFQKKWHYTERSLMCREATVLVQKIWGDLLEVQPSRIKKVGEDKEKRWKVFLNRKTHICLGPEVKKKDYRQQSYTEVTQPWMKWDVRTGMRTMFTAYLACGNGKLLVTTDSLADIRTRLHTHSALPQYDSAGIYTLHSSATNSFCADMLTVTICRVPLINST
jgi:hypothetical protein